jgi:D-3-phosphoglycerate dehydrogenase
MKFHILNAEPLEYSDEARSILYEIGPVNEYQHTHDSLLHCIKDYEVLIVRLGLSIDREIIQAARNLKVIVTATTGLDHIDIEYAGKRNIEVLSLQGETEFLRSIPATAEHTWGLLLSLVRKIPQASYDVRCYNWDRDKFRGNDLFQKKLGILGLGRIGEKVAKYGLAFGMQVSAYDPYRSDWIKKINRAFSLENLLENSDILTIHVPLNNETLCMIGADELSILPNSAFLINTSRGKIIDEEALFQMLTAGKIAGAALDVLAEEREQSKGSKKKLIEYAKEHNNLIITPHIGGATIESMAMTEVFMAKKLKALLRKFYQFRVDELDL